MPSLSQVEGWHAPAGRRTCETLASDPGQADQTGSAGGCQKNWDPAGRSFRKTTRAASAESEVRPGPRLPTLRAHHVKIREAAPVALSTLSLPNILRLSRLIETPWTLRQIFQICAHRGGAVTRQSAAPNGGSGVPRSASRLSSHYAGWAGRPSLRGGRSLAEAPVAGGVSSWSLVRVDPVRSQMAGPSAAALIRSGVCATGYAVRVPGITTVSREPVIHRRSAESMMRAGADMVLEA